MATIKGTKKQARKRHRQSLERRMRNKAVRTRVRRQMRAMRAAIQEVLTTAYTRRGASIKDYRDPEGGKGNASSMLLLISEMDADGKRQARVSLTDGRACRICRDQGLTVDSFCREAGSVFSSASDATRQGMKGGCPMDSRTFMPPCGSSR